VIWVFVELFDVVWLQVWSDFYQAGSLVFGGGHVVLPLLQTSLGSELGSDELLLAYSTAQAVPGPMFSMATYLGGALLPSSPLLGATVATFAIFTPGFLLVLGLQKAWLSLSSRPRVAGAVSGVNASVVGLLLAALYSPIFLSAVKAPGDMVAVILGVFALRVLKCPVLILVAVAMVVGYALG